MTVFTSVEKTVGREIPSEILQELFVLFARIENDHQIANRFEMITRELGIERQSTFDVAKRPEWLESSQLGKDDVHMTTVDPMRSMGHTSIDAGPIFEGDKNRTTATVGVREMVMFDRTELFEIGSSKEWSVNPEGITFISYKRV